MGFLQQHQLSIMLVLMGVCIILPFLTMSNTTLVLTRQNANQATADLTMRATSDGQHVDFNVHVVINEIVDLPPYIVIPVQDVVMDEFPKIVYVDFSGVATDPDDPDELIEYTMLSNSNEAAVSSTMGDRVLMLERLTEEQAEAEIAMRATSDGQYVDFNFRVIMNHVEGVEESDMSFKVYPNPTSGLLTIDADGAQQFDFEVYNLMGQVVMNGMAIGQKTRIDLGGCPKGVYFVSVRYDGNCVVQKVIVR